MAIQLEIRPIAGATLTAQAVSQAVRRVMAIDQVLTAEVEATPGRAGNAGDSIHSTSSWL